MAIIARNFKKEYLIGKEICIIIGLPEIVLILAGHTVDPSEEELSNDQYKNEFALLKLCHQGSIWQHIGACHTVEDKIKFNSN